MIFGIIGVIIFVIVVSYLVNVHKAKHSGGNGSEKSESKATSAGKKAEREKKLAAWFERTKEKFARKAEEIRRKENEKEKEKKGDGQSISQRVSTEDTKEPINTFDIRNEKRTKAKQPFVRVSDVQIEEPVSPVRSKKDEKLPDTHRTTIAKIALKLPGAEPSDEYIKYISPADLPILIGRATQKSGDYKSYFSIPSSVDGTVSSAQMSIELSEGKKLLVRDLSSNSTTFDSEGRTGVFDLHRTETDIMIGSNGSRIQIKLYNDAAQFINPIRGYHAVISAAYYDEQSREEISFPGTYKWYVDNIIGRDTFSDKSHPSREGKHSLAPQNALTLTYDDKSDGFVATVCSNTKIIDDETYADVFDLVLEKGKRFWVGRLMLTVISLEKTRIGTVISD